MYVWIFLFGLTLAPRSLLSYVLAAELTPKQTQSVYTSMAMFIDSLCMMGLGAYFWKVSRNMDGLMWALTVVQVVVCVAIAWGVPESPKYLFEKGKKKEFNETIRWIAKVNGKGQVNIDEII